MGTSSARPEDLDVFASGSRAADEVLTDFRAGLARTIDHFTTSSPWARFDAGSLINGFATYVDLNDEDAAWVSQISAAFRRAGGEGVLRLPDAAIEASLRAAGLDHDRGSLDYVDPIAFGMPPTSGYANDPVNTALGNFVELETDLQFGGALATLAFRRVYNSCSDREGAFGHGWSSWASARLTARPDGVDYEGPDGQRAHFPRSGESFGRTVGIDALVERYGNGLALAWFGGDRWVFDAAGRPARVSAGPGTSVTFTWDEQGRLASLAHERGRRIDVRWEGPRITGLASSDGRVVDYRYDTLGYLVEAMGDAGTRSYAIDVAGLIASVTDADGVVELVNTYDEHGRVRTQLSPFGRRTSFSYLPGNVTVTADDSGGPMNTYVHDRAGRLTAAIDGHDQTFRRNYDEWGNPVAIIERNGAVTVQEWDERSRLLRRTVASGASLAFTYDDADRVLSVTASDGAQTRFGYQGEERSPSEIVDPEGGVTRLTVVNGLVLAAVDPDGVTVALRYDDDGNVIAVTDADGGTGRIERDRAGRPVAVVSPAGRRTTFGYNRRGLLTSRTDPDGATWRYEYSPVGRPTATIDPLGGRTELHYGDHGHLEEVVDALGARTLRRYDALGNITGLTGPDGSKWTYTYDALCRLSSTTDPAGSTWLREYDVVGNLVGSIDPTGIRRSATVDLSGNVTGLSDGLTTGDFEFDEFGRTLAHIRPNGAELRATYDRCGRRVAMAESDGGTLRLEYSPAGRIRRIISAAGREERFEYDRCGRLAATLDGTGARWELRRDADGAVVARVWPTGESEELIYDAAGRLLVHRTPSGGSTTYGYDAAGRVTSISDATGGVRRFAHDVLGRVVAATDANGDTSRYTYDERGWLVRVTDPLGGLTTRTYDEVGRLVAQTDPLDRTTTYAYDAAGHLLQRTDPTGGRVHWSYDVSGRVRDIRGAGATESIWIERDELGRPVAYVEPGHERQELRWGAGGRLTERRRGDLAMSWTYDVDGERTSLGFPDGSTMTYERDGAGRAVAVDHPILGRVQMDRDAAGRLVAVRGSGVDATWTYRSGALAAYEVRQGHGHSSTDIVRDTAGRVAAVTTDSATRRFGYDAAGQLVSDEGPDGVRTYSYDAAGRLTGESGPEARSWDYDAAGQLTASGERTFGYDAAGRRTEERDVDTVRSYGWDWLGRPTGVRSSGSDGAMSSTRWRVDAMGELADIDGMPVMWDTADPFSPLTWLGGTPVVSAGPEQAMPGVGSPWLDVDWLGSVAGSAGGPWGAAGRGPALGYRGELCTDGLVWLRNRIYDPTTRAFLSPDPLPAVPGTAVVGNVYHYAGNDPLNHLDPLGLRPMTDLDFQNYKNSLNSGFVGGAEHWLADNWEYIAGAALVAGGIALAAFVFPIAAAVAVAPLAVIMTGGAVVGAGGSILEQKIFDGNVDWRKVGVSAVVGALTAPVGFAVGDIITTGLVSKGVGEASSIVIGDMLGNGIGGIVGRDLEGKRLLDPWALSFDLLTGGIAGGLHARFGGETPHAGGGPTQMPSDPMPQLPAGSTHLALPPGEPQLALPPGPTQLALPPGPPVLTLAPGPLHQALPAPSPQLMLAAPRPQLLLTAGG